MRVETSLLNTSTQTKSTCEPSVWKGGEKRRNVTKKKMKKNVYSYESAGRKKKANSRHGRKAGYYTLYYYRYSIIQVK